MVCLETLWFPSTKIFFTYSALANKEKSKLVEAISIPEMNIAFITPDLIANKPPSRVKITVVNHPRPFE